MKTSIDEIKGIILSINEYKEYDSIVKMVTENKIIDFIAKGVLKQTSKNRMLCQPFSYVSLQLTHTSFPVLITGNVIQSYYKISQDLMNQAICNCLCDLLLHTEIDLNLFHLFDQVLHRFHIDDKKKYTLACMFIKDILIKDGFSMHVNDCILCHTKNNLETISIKDGGFLCHNCNQGKYKKMHKDELIQYYSLFQYKEEKSEEFINYYTFSFDQMFYLMEWYCLHEQIHLKSFQFLQEIRYL